MVCVEAKPKTKRKAIENSNFFIIFQFVSDYFNSRITLFYELTYHAYC